jgi:hypothetical protein
MEKIRKCDLTSQVTPTPQKRKNLSILERFSLMANISGNDVSGVAAFADLQSNSAGGRCLSASKLFGHRKFSVLKRT